jgi:hypothetical protein
MRVDPTALWWTVFCYDELEICCDELDLIRVVIVDAGYLADADGWASVIGDNG